MHIVPGPDLFTGLSDHLPIFADLCPLGDGTDGELVSKGDRVLYPDVLPLRPPIDLQDLSFLEVY